MDAVGIVEQVRLNHSGLSFVLHCDAKRSRIRVRVDEGEIFEGDRVHVKGISSIPLPPGNPGEFNSLIYEGARGIYRDLRAEHVEILSRGHWPYVCRHVFLNQMRKVLGRLLPEAQEGAVLAILTGDRSDMDPGMTEAFQDCGIAHIIAVSGLHIQVLSTMLEWCLTKVFARKKALAGTALCVWMYCFLTGGAVSTIRAALMLTIRLAAVLCGRREDPLNSLGISAICILGWRPLYLFDAAFQLSFMATLALFLAQRPWLRLFWIPIKLRKSLAASLAVVLWSAPVTLYHFHQISLYAILLNLLVIPLMSVVIIVSIAATMVSFVSADAARFLAGCVYYVLVLYRASCAFLLRWPGGILRIGTMPWAAVISFYGMYLLWILDLRKKKGLCLLRYGCLLVCCLALLLQRMETQVLFLSIGQGDCTLLRSRGRTYIIDAGPGYDRVLKPALTYYGVHKIDGVFLTHMDQDHSEGVLRLLTDPDFRVHHVYLPNQQIHDFQDICVIADKNTLLLRRGDRLHLPGIDITVLSPDPEEIYADENSASLCLQAQTKHGTICCMGDADQETEERILASGMSVECDVLKAGHHGSRTSSSEAFLSAASPSVAFISCKKNNSYGHPHQEVLDRLKACNIQPVISFESGCLIMDDALYSYQEAFRKRWMQ